MTWVSRLLQPLPGPCRCNRSSPKYILLRYGNSLYFFPIFFPYSSQGRFHRWLEAILALKHNDYSSCVFRGFPIFFRVAFTDGIEPLPPEETGLRPQGWGMGLSPTSHRTAQAQRSSLSAGPAPVIATRDRNSTGSALRQRQSVYRLRCWPRVYPLVCDATLARMNLLAASGSVGQASITRCKSDSKSPEIGLSAPDNAPPLQAPFCNPLSDRLVTPFGSCPAGPIRRRSPPGASYGGCPPKPRRRRTG